MRDFAEKSRVLDELKEFKANVSLSKSVLLEGDSVVMRAIAFRRADNENIDILITIFPLRPIFEDCNNAKLCGAIEEFKSALRDSDWHVRVSAANKLGMINHPDVVPVLQTLLNDEIVHVRKQAQKALIALSSPIVNRRFLIGVQLELKSAKAKARKAITNQKGQAWFCNLPPGEFEIRVL